MDEEDSEFKEEDEDEDEEDLNEEDEEEVEGWDDDENVVIRRSRPNINEQDDDDAEEVADESRDLVPSELKPSQESANSISRPKPRKQRLDSAASSQLSKKD